EDDSYQSFEKTFTNVMTINKIARTISADPVGSSYKANLLVNELPVDAYPGDGTVEYAVSTTQGVPSSGWQASRAIMNLAQGNYYIFARVQEGENYLATSNAAQATSAVAVEGIDVTDTMGYNTYMQIKTSNIDNAGTDSVIKGRYYYLDGTASDLTHFDLDGNDFEQGDEDSYLVEGPKRVPWMITELEIDYTRDGTKPGWHCEYVQPFANILKYVPPFSFPEKRVEGSPISVEQWFGAEDHDQKHVVWTGSTGSMKRVITDVGNFEDISAAFNLNGATTGSYTFTYDGKVLDQYGYRFINNSFEADTYNAYDYMDAPALSIQASKKAYASCLDFTINSFTIDQEALYAAMREQGDSEITLTATLQFPERSTTAGTATWTKTIKVTLAD
ncbi:MAG: hypothetical protein GXY49_11285, partial [Syntrophomonadaceae bacterium]|nr:hypothetical protein [Syntrophomonadaceae bacterium]